MENLKCENCGASVFTEKNEYLVCGYCDSIQLIMNTSESKISVDYDVKNLLDKMKNDSSNKKMYADLILEIDPTNKEIRKYL